MVAARPRFAAGRHHKRSRHGGGCARNHATGLRSHAAASSAAAARGADSARRIGLVCSRSRVAARFECGRGQQRPAARPRTSARRQRHVGAAIRTAATRSARPVRGRISKRRRRRTGRSIDRGRDVYEMPPFITWFHGGTAIGGFLGPRMRAFGKTPVIRTTANGQPAVALYPATADGQHRLHALHVLTLVSQGVGRVVAFMDVDGLRSFDLPHVLSTEAT